MQQSWGGFCTIYLLCYSLQANKSRAGQTSRWLFRARDWIPPDVPAGDSLLVVVTITQFVCAKAHWQEKLFHNEAATNVNDPPDMWFIWICGLVSRLMELVYFFFRCAPTGSTPPFINHIIIGCQSIRCDWVLLRPFASRRRTEEEVDCRESGRQASPAHTTSYVSCHLLLTTDESTDLRVTFKNNKTKKKPSLFTAATICP